MKKHETRLAFNLVATKSGRPPRHLVVVLHGIGSSKEQMMETAEFLSRSMEDTLVLVPEGPGTVLVDEGRLKRIREQCPDFDPARAKSWFSMNFLTLPFRMLFNRVADVRALNALIDDVMEEHHLQDSDLSFFGFSQGGAMALYTAFNRNAACASVVCHSGGYVGMGGIKSRPRTLMITGEKDIRTIDELKESAKKKGFFRRHILELYAKIYSQENAVRLLEKRGVPVESLIVGNMGHETNPESLTKSLEFILDSIKATP